MGRSTSVRAVLLQVREHLEARDHERLCFLESSGLPDDRLECIDMVRAPGRRWSEIAGADLYFIGGSGEFSATNEHPFTPALTRIVEEIVDGGRPLLGSCWGHQFLARVLGAEVVTDRTRGEVGTFDVELNGDGMSDPLFEDCPRRFAVHLGHHDRVAALVPGMVELAASDACPVQVLRLAGKPIYGTQFHAEMNEDHMRARLLMYRDAYLPAGLTPEAFGALLRPTPVVAGLVRRFVELYG